MSLSVKWLRWLPWNFVIKRLARAHGFLDPIVLLSQLQRFTQPAEVSEPVELLRAGVVFHARGLINSRVIQHNLDWVWPYWVEQQFDPNSVSFIPRAFSITHINLTHRNWTAIGLPNYPDMPIVDPRGLLTPFLDQWSLDVWLIKEDGAFLLPSRTANTVQQLHVDDGLTISTESHLGESSLKTEATVIYKAGIPNCCLNITVETPQADTLAIVLRPYNPEGVSFIYQLNLSEQHSEWTVNGQEKIIFDRPMTQHYVSDYRQGDVYSSVNGGSFYNNEKSTEPFALSHQCDIGMLTAAALFTLEPKQLNQLSVNIPLITDDKNKKKTLNTKHTDNATRLWENHLSQACQLQIPDKKMQLLYDSALRTLVLHSVDKVYPGPYTYKRFWYRDATFIVYALLCTGLTKRAEKALDYFPTQQAYSGYFHSQEGEWDSNGQALWIFSQFSQFTHEKTKPAWQSSIDQGVRWLIKKRLPDLPESPHSGLLPAGFSAEHLGPNDYYYWDDFWSLAGLQAIYKGVKSQVAGEVGEGDLRLEIEHVQSAIEKSLSAASQRLDLDALPASPYRRLDSGAIGSLVASYPLQLCEPQDLRLMNTVEFLLKNCCFQGGFFQDMIHSGINPYLTLHIAQVLLRAGDSRFFTLMTTVADLASSTGQWPEAIHPHTGGGCMGDGQHAWAAAEWLVMMRNCFVREEDDHLILASGITAVWWQTGQCLSFGVAPTQFGSVSVSIQYKEQYEESMQQQVNKYIVVSWQGDWHDQAPRISVNLPGFTPVIADAKQTQIIINAEILL